MQARLESSALGRAVIGVLILVVLAGIAVPNLPDSQVRAALTPPAQPFFDATTLNQSWGVFSPNPRGISIWTDVRVDNADGTSELWGLPGDDWLGAYRRYRWHKFGEYVRVDDQTALWTPFARHVADRARADGQDPVRVTLTRRWWEIPPPGSGPGRGPEQAYQYFTTTDLRPAR